MESSQDPNRTAQSENLVGKERRACKRSRCGGPAEVAVLDNGVLIRGEIQNISKTGCYIGTRAHLRFGRSTEVELRFTVRGNFFNILARAMMVQPGKGAGFKFALENPKMEKSLLNLLHQLESAAANDEAHAK